MKQTAVEWLIEQWPILESQLPDWLIEQAKEMEKEQIIRAGADHCYPTKEIAIQFAIKFFSRV